MIADRHEDATILFVDLVGFTSLSTQYPPDKVLDILSKIFARFDGAVAAHGLEKIKTVGDAYMVAGGLPEPIADQYAPRGPIGHRDASDRTPTARFAALDLKARIGIHAGPVIAGVIGARNWGDTVNTASRVEHSAPPIASTFRRRCDAT